MAGRFEKRELIGSGTFGKVFLAICHDNGERYAVKEVRVSGLSEKDLQQVMTEVSVLAYSKHINIIRYKVAYVDRGLLNVVMEFADGGDLHSKIQIQKRLSQHLPEKVILEWFVQICSGIRYLHSKNILHRDLKTQNIFLTKNQTVKIGDFGISKVLDHTSDQARTVVGTPYFFSPEICQRHPYNQKSDMWAIGCVLYELTSLRYPFEGSEFNQLVVSILHGRYKPIPEQYSSLVQDLISVLLQTKSDQRPSAEKILCLPDLKVYMEAYIQHLQTSLAASPKPSGNRPTPGHSGNKPTPGHSGNKPTPGHSDNRPTPGHSGNKENIEPPNCDVAKPRKYSLVTPRTRLPLKEKRCYSNEQGPGPEVSKRPKLSVKPPPSSSLYKRAIAHRRVSMAKKSPVTNHSPVNIQTDAPMDSPKTESPQTSDVEMSEDVFEETPEKSKKKTAIDSTTYTIPKPKLDAEVLKILFFYGLAGKSNLVKTSEGLRYFLEQRMGCDQFFRLYLAVKDVLSGREDVTKFRSCLDESGSYWPVLYYLVQLDQITTSL